MLSKKNKDKLIKSSRISDKDTGSPEVQIAILSEKIKKLSGHLKEHRGDKHSRVGLVKMVEKRKNNLNYLSKKDKNRYETVMKKIKR